MKNISFKKDKYRRSRGGYSRLLEIHCAKCNSSVALYQKDGPGILKRMYVDRILKPDSLLSKKELKCKNCGETLGMRYIYKKEKRPAFRLFEGAVIKKVRRLAE